MAKKGMSRIDRTHTKPRNTEPPVPEIQGKAKSGKEHAKPIVASTQGHTKGLSQHTAQDRKTDIPRG